MNAKPSFGALAGAMLLAGQAQAIDCAVLPVWQSSTVYTGGNQVRHNDNAYQANYWTQNNNPEQFSGPWQHWSLLGSCDGAADPQPPYGSIASPDTDSAFAENDIAVTFVAADDSDGAVIAVEFFVDGIAIGTDSVAPGQMNWSAQVGNHSLTARIEDNDGLDITTEPVPVSVSASDPDKPLAVSLTAPADGGHYDEDVSVALEATASVAEGPVARVEFYVGGVEVGEDTSSPTRSPALPTAAGILSAPPTRKHPSPACGGGVGGRELRLHPLPTLPKERRDGRKSFSQGVLSRC